MRRQPAERRRRPVPVVRAAFAAIALVWPMAAAWAQAGTARTSITPYASAQLTLTDNYELNSGSKSADAITRLTAGVAMRSTAGRVQGQLDYSLSALLYAQHGDRSTHQHQLSANGEIEWYERQGYLTAAASISQVARSAFDAPVRPGGLPGSNTTQMRSISLSPRWQGLLPGGLQIRASLNGRLDDAEDSLTGDVTTLGASVRVSPFRPGPLSWAADVVHSKTSYELTTSVRSSRAYGTLIWNVTDLDLLLNARAGVERSNLATQALRDDATWGAGLEWRPSPRTRVAADLEERGFGRSHLALVEYRTPRTTWRLSTSRNINTGGGELGNRNADLLRTQLFEVYAAIEPDFFRRMLLVDEVLRTGSFLRGAVTIDDRQEASVSWRGPRLVASLNLSHAVSRRANLLLTGRDDLDLSDRIRLDAVTVNLSHKLTPQSYVALLLTGQTGRGDLTAQRTRQHGMSLTWGGQFSSDDSWSLSLRRMWYETNLVPYSETALTATYGIRF